MLADLVEVVVPEEADGQEVVAVEEDAQHLAHRGVALRHMQM